MKHYRIYSLLTLFLIIFLAETTKAQTTGSLETLQSMLENQIELLQNEHYHVAVEKGMETVSYANKYFGDSSVESEMAKSFLAKAYLETGKYEEAERLNREALVNLEQELGKDSELYLMNMFNLIHVNKWIGKYSEAITLQLDALEIIERNYGKQNTYYTNNVNNLAELYREMGEFSKGVCSINCVRFRV